MISYHQTVISAHLFITSYRHRHHHIIIITTLKVGDLSCKGWAGGFDAQRVVMHARGPGMDPKP